MTPERTIPNIPESAFTTTPVLGDTLDTPVTVRSVVLEDERSVLYSVENSRQLGRSAIDSIIRQPLDEPEHGWRETRNSLRTIGLDSRKMQRLGQRARISDHLTAIRGASAQLADTLTRNQAEQVTNATIPVMNYYESRQVAADTLLDANSHKLLLQLKSLGYDVYTARHFLRFIGSYSGSSPFELDNLEQLDPTIASLEKEIVNGAILGEASESILQTLLADTRDDLFDSFIVKGSWPPEETYILKTDMPVGMVQNRISDISVGATHAMPTRDGRVRRHVRFYADQTPIYARPLLIWRKDAKGNRSFRFPSRPFDQPMGNAQSVTRPNSLVGAALLANVFGQEIDYKSELSYRLRHAELDRSRLGMAGLWALVADFKQDRLMNTPYIEEIEYILHSK